MDTRELWILWLREYWSFAVGRATRLIRFIQEQPKEYIGDFILGKRSDTDDTTGNITETPDQPVITREQLALCLPAFQGQIEQVPPQFSAVHINGQRAYKRARRGESFEIQPRLIEVFELELTHFDFPRFQLRIVCGSGTYIRSIGRDLGETLGCGAVMESLVRTRIGDFPLTTAMHLNEEITIESIASQLHPSALAVNHVPQFQCNSQELDDLCHGRVIECDPSQFTSQPVGQITKNDQQDEIAVMSSAGTLIAIAEWNRSTNELAPRQVFYP